MAVSVRKEKLEDATEHAVPAYQYRLIVRTPEVRWENLLET